MEKAISFFDGIRDFSYIKRISVGTVLQELD